jgi:hypothetical protein
MIYRQNKKKKLTAYLEIQNYNATVTVCNFFQLSLIVLYIQFSY